MKYYALVGSDIQASPSPAVHKRLFEERGVLADYRLIQTRSLKPVLAELKALHGFNVTIPFKTGIIKHLDGLSTQAEEYAAVNTVKNEGGRLIGHNTDGFGFLQAYTAVPGSVAQTASGNDFLIAGAGATARTIACVLLKLGCRVTLAVRNINSKNARFTVNHLKRYPQNAVKIIEMPQDANLSALNCQKCYTINTVPAPIRADFDVSAATKSGLAMLEHQAAKAQEFWAGR